MPRHLIGDAHEWINEIPTVPTHSLAKLQPSQRSWDHLCIYLFMSQEPIYNLLYIVLYFSTHQHIVLLYFIIIIFYYIIIILFILYFVFVQQRGKKTLLSLTLICYCHLVGMVKIVRGSLFIRRPWDTTTWRFGWLTVHQVRNCLYCFVA